MSLCGYENCPLCKMVNYYFHIVKIPFPNIVSPETQSVNYSVVLC